MLDSKLRRWSSLISDSACRGSFRQTIYLFRQLLQENLRPNSFILPSVLRACANTQDLKTGRELHNFIFRCLDCLDPFINTALIDMYSKCGRVQLARTLFDRMPERDLITWNAMVSGYAQQGSVKNGLVLVEEMRSMGVKPDIVTWNALIAGFSLGGEDEMAINLFQTMKDDGICPDVVSWTSIISGFTKNLQYDMAFKMFRRMILAGTRPTSVTISSLLPACSNVANLRLGEEIHGYVVVAGIEEDIFVSSSLVDMYAKCGFIFKAERLFYKMHGKNVVSYNSMIFGYANNGNCDKAINLFEQMVEGGELGPDYLTFVAVIMCCSHAGWVVLGKKLFTLMQEKYGIEPRLEHYACMVDLLGRAGRISDAYEFIKMMPVDPDAFVWGALLGACQRSGNIELAELSALHLLELEPRSVGSHVTLSGILMNSGRWEDAAKLKKMVQRRLRRSIGCSWLDAV
ncbi:pentatricopeptide repeat-containing protein At5g59600 [Aristolochia californica]|uniref:pentatricopeptide repeat-containing protein At5g59600 n=1 Tax=Aristolochia californica TaxID=171875 RepID=UPI0035DF0267